MYMNFKNKGLFFALTVQLKSQNCKRRSHYHQQQLTTAVKIIPTVW